MPTSTSTPAPSVGANDVLGVEVVDDAGIFSPKESLSLQLGGVYSTVDRRLVVLTIDEPGANIKQAVRSRAVAAHPQWLGTAGAAWPADMVIIAVNVRTLTSAILYGENSRRPLDPVLPGLTSQLASTVSTGDFLGGLNRAETDIRSALQSDYSRRNQLPPANPRTPQQNAAFDALNQWVLLPLFALICGAVGAYLDGRRRERAGLPGSDDRSAWFDGDFDDGGD